MLQKMKRIGEYMEKKGDSGETREQIFQHIRELIASSPKNKETLTGIDKLLTQEQRSNTAPC